MRSLQRFTFLVAYLRLYNSLRGSVRPSAREAVEFFAEKLLRPSAVVGRKKILSIATMLARFSDLLGSMLSIFEKILLGKF